MPKSLSRGPARLLALAVALGGPAVVVTPADAATGDGVPTTPEVQASAGPDSVHVSWSASEPGTDTVDEEQPGDETEQPGDETEQPGDETEQPGDETEQPGDETEQPWDEEPWDEELDPEPVEDFGDLYAFTQPADSVDETEQSTDEDESTDEQSDDDSSEEEVSDLDDNAIAYYDVALYDGSPRCPSTRPRSTPTRS